MVGPISLEQIFEMYFATIEVLPTPANKRQKLIRKHNLCHKFMI